MKSKIILRIVFLLATAFLIITCTKSDIEKARDAYDATKVFPVIQALNGPTSVLKTFRFEYSVAGTTRAGSTIAWTGVDCVIDSLSADKTKAWVKFTTTPATDTAKVKVIETTIGGVASAEVIKKVKVNPFCPLPIAGFVGTWGGTDGYGSGSQSFASQVVISARNSTSVNVTGLNKGWMEGYWGETITAGGTIPMKVNANGTTEIADQYFCTTVYDGAPYIYWIKGTGLWANCGAKPTLTLSYNVYYKDPTQGGTYPSATTKFTAALVKN